MQSFIEKVPKGTTFFTSYKDAIDFKPEVEISKADELAFLQKIVNPEMARHTKNLVLAPDYKVHVVFDINTLRNTKAIVACCSLEVGWLYTGRVHRDDERMIIYYDEIHVPEQTISGVETDITPKGVTQVFNYAYNNNKQVVGWGHSHVNMGVSPSGTDDRTFEEITSDSPTMTRLICNKKGDLKIDVSWKMWEDLPHVKRMGISWIVDNLGGELRSFEHWQNVVNDNCSRQVSTYTPSNYHSPATVTSTVSYNWTQQNKYRK
jgi:proteasome lid subunit RPN8/RPN11